MRAASGGRGLGSAFTVRLPLATRPRAAAPARRRGHEAGGQRTASSSWTTTATPPRAWPPGWPWTATRWRSRTTAATRCTRPPTAPELVLLDLGLPDLDGFEVARRLRASAAGSDLHLVAVTGWGQDEDRRRTSEAGFDLHLTKPVEPGRLIDAIAAACSPYRAAAVTRQIALPTSSATSSAPRLSIATPTGRP